eukprot:3946502-Pleurochrysis_carterae.AAC.4
MDRWATHCSLFLLPVANSPASIMRDAEASQQQMPAIKLDARTSVLFADHRSRASTTHIARTHVPSQ